MASAPRIFVAIAAYTDPELPRTLRDALDTARLPEHFASASVGRPTRSARRSRAASGATRAFASSTRRSHESRGGPWARNIAQSLWRGEPYTLQVDSHMKFEPEWDSRLIDMLEALPSDKPILSIERAAVLVRRCRGAASGDSTWACRRPGSARGTRTPWAPWFDFGPPNTQSPGRTRFVNGNFAFSRGVWNVEVPQDPGQYYWGEEINVTVRSYTWGYDFFLPNEVVAWHMEHRDGPPRRHWEHGDDVVQRRNAEAFARLGSAPIESRQPSAGALRFRHARTRCATTKSIAGFDFRQAGASGRLQRRQPRSGDHPLRRRLGPMRHVRGVRGRRAD